jgi:predicted secreted protein
LQKYPTHHETFQITSKKNSEFIIRVTSSVSCGLEWRVHFDDQYLQLKSREYKVKHPGRIGGQDDEIFIFQSIRPGDTKIEMKYLRPCDITELYRIHIYEVKINP